MNTLREDPEKSGINILGGLEAELHAGDWCYRNHAVLQSAGPRKWRLTIFEEQLAGRFCEEQADALAKHGRPP